MHDRISNSDSLTLSESLSLLYIGTAPHHEDLPDADAARLMQLGLARIDNGRFTYTRLGQEIADWTARISSASVDRVH